MGTIYLLHFEEPISPYHTTQHYLGYADNIHRRITEHRAGRGARLTQVAKERGIKFEVARTWHGTRADERKLKRRKNGHLICPICAKKQGRKPQPCKGIRGSF